jgi:hypothetical protein
MTDGALRRLGVLVGAVVLVVGVAAVIGLVAADAPPERTDATVDKDYFTAESLLEESQLASRSGDIDLADGPSRTVVVSTDRAPSDIEPVLTALVEHGHDVRLRDHSGGLPRGIPIGIVGGVGAAQSTGGDDGPDLATTLDDADALLVVGGSQFEQADTDTIENFTDAGGRLMVATDPFGSFGRGPGGDSITSRYGVAVGSGYVYNMHEHDANYQRVFAESTNADLANGISDVVVDGAAPLRSDRGTALVSAGGETRYSETRSAGSYALAVRNGNALALGDVDLMRATNYNRADNNQLLGNALEFLTDGPADPYDPVAESGGPERPRPTPPQGAQPPA